MNEMADNLDGPNGATGTGGPGAPGAFSSMWLFGRKCYRDWEMYVAESGALAGAGVKCLLVSEKMI
jgi:hypothetical protein